MKCRRNKRVAVREAGGRPDVSALTTIGGVFETRRRSPAYVLALAVTALLMILIPLMYLSLAAAIGYGVIYYVENAWDPIFTTSVPWMLGLFAYLAPPFAGMMMILFMFKAILSRQERKGRVDPVEVDASEPFIEYVRNIARAVGAPLPCKVVVDANANASAQFAPGFANLLRRRLVLTVGLPLLSGMNTREIAGIIAHEFGHFSQGVGMYFSLVIRRISYWLHRVVYERDEWFVYLEEPSPERNWWLGALFKFSGWMVWLNRKVLWCFMMLGHMISFHLLRQMEFDADQFESRVAGSDYFVRTSEHLVLLSAAWQRSMPSVWDGWDDRRLPEEFGTLVSRCERALGDDERKAILSASYRHESSLWDTHPDNVTRVLAVERRPVAGVYTLEEDCTLLFRDFGAFSREASGSYYRSIWGDAALKATLIPVPEFSAEMARKQEDWRFFSRFFGRVAGIGLPLKFSLQDGLLPPEERQAVVSELGAAHTTIAATMDEIARVDGTYDETVNTLFNVLQGVAVLKAGFVISEGQFGFSGTTLADGTEAVDELRGTITIVRRKLSGLLDPVRKRLEMGLRLMHPMNEETAVHVSTAGALSGVDDVWRQVAETSAGVNILLGQNPDAVAGYEQTLEEFCRDMRTSFDDLCRRLDGVPFPFPEEIAVASIGAHLDAGGIGPQAPAADVYAHVNRGLQRAGGIYVRVMGRIARAVENAEKEAGLDPVAIDAAWERTVEEG